MRPFSFLRTATQSGRGGVNRVTPELVEEDTRLFFNAVADTNEIIPLDRTAK